MRLTVGHLKGGTGKTTTAVHLALGLARSGRTLLVDADPDQDGALAWSQLAEDWPADRCIVIEAADRHLTRQLQPMLDDYAHVILDVGPKNPNLLRQALTLSEHLIVPVRPTGTDLAAIERVFELAAEADALSPLTASLLLVDVDSRWKSGSEARAWAESEDIPTITAQVRHLVEFAVARGTAPEQLGDYELVLDELIKRSFQNDLSSFH
ncbi:ParA family protein [Pseudonocardia sp. ICBG1293]|uniref:ParA family protein n=1 Tax=Pseudonocardia sp. ICBG1293 TaxID=2844382 RepID=UPI001CCA8A56|nr:ParA family protein [Pseudonocardia sp. ICBG1293]